MWRRGTCGITVPGYAGDCATGEQGSLVSYSRTECVQQCLACSRCAYISFSQRDLDCSWFSRCPDLSGAPDHVTARIGGREPVGIESLESTQCRLPRPLASAAIAGVWDHAPCPFAVVAPEYGVFSSLHYLASIQLYAAFGRCRPFVTSSRVWRADGAESCESLLDCLFALRLVVEELWEWARDCRKGGDKQQGKLGPV